MKETNELYEFLGKLSNGVLSDAEDGDLNPLKDFPKYLPALLAGQPGFSGLSEFKAEQTSATVIDKENSLEVLTSNMQSGSPETRYDIAHAIHGVVGLYSAGVRIGKEEGAAEERAKIKAELEAAGVDFASVRSLV